MDPPPAPPPPPPAASKVDLLLAETEASIRRLKALQQQRHSATLGSRISSHFNRHGSNLVSLALAGSVLAVAVGRLGQKYEHEAEVEALQAQAAALRRRAEGGDLLARQLEQAVGAGSARRLAAEVRAALEAYRERAAPPAAAAETAVVEQAAAAAAAAAAAPRPPPPKGGLMV
jgi:hypothetical protein